MKAEFDDASKVLDAGRSAAGIQWSASHVSSPY